MTLIAMYNSDGCIRRCDAKCHNAVTSLCTCICGGLNHGVGKVQAIKNTREIVGDLLKKDETDKIQIPDSVKQMDFGELWRAGNEGTS